MRCGLVALLGAGTCAKIVAAAGDVQTLIQLAPEPLPATQADSSTAKLASAKDEAFPRPTWPDCQVQNTRIRSGAEDLYVDLTDYGGPNASGACSGSYCNDADELELDDPDKCALICHATTNCKYWTWGPEASKMKCWLRTGMKQKTTNPAEANGYITGAQDCRPDADFSADHPATGEVVTFQGQECPETPYRNAPKHNLNGKDFLRLGTTADGKPYYYNKETKSWLYYDKNCNGRTGTRRTWFPHWVVMPSPPSNTALEDLDGDYQCKAIAYSEDRHGDEYGPTSAGWKVDCSGTGELQTLALNVVRSGFLLEVWPQVNDNLEAVGRPVASRLDPRIDYWVTSKAWEGFESAFDGKFYAEWTSYLMIKKAGDYEFSLGTADVAKLEWYHEESDSWASYKHDGAGVFSYSSTADLTPETKRTLSPGYHKFRVAFWRRYTNSTGIVLKVKGPDFGGAQWKVVPSSALSIEQPGCMAPGSSQAAACVEGFVVPANGMCTINTEGGKCGSDQVAVPAQVRCTPNGISGSLGRFQCVYSAAKAAKVAARKATKAEQEVEPTPIPDREWLEPESVDPEASDSTEASSEAAEGAAAESADLANNSTAPQPAPDAPQYWR